MFNHTRRTASRRGAGARRGRRLVAIAAAGLLLCSCGSSTKGASSGATSGASVTTTGATTAATAAGGSSGGPSGVAYANAQLAQYEPNASFTAPGPALTNVASLKGKTVWYVPIALQVPFFAGIIAGMKNALGTVGMSLHVCDGAGIASTIAQCLNQAAGAKPAVVVTDSITPDLAPTAFAALKAAHVPVLSSDEGYPSPSTDQLAYLSYSGLKMAALVADSIIARSQGKADILVAEVSDTGYTTVAIQQGTVPEFKKYCPACKVKVIAATTANYSQYATLTATAFTADPSINYVIPEYDSTIMGVVQGLENAGPGTINKVKMASSTSTITGLQDVKSGKLIADVGFDVYKEGFANVDQALRMALGQPPVQNENLGLKVFTPANVTGLTLTPAAADNGSWFGTGDFVAGFKKLWGVS